MYRNLMSIYYRDSHAAILVFDYTNKESMENLKYWLNELDDRVNANDIIIKIAGNKYDLYESCEDKMDVSDIKELLSDFETEKFEFINTSAKTGQNIAQLFTSVAKDCYEKYETDK